MLGSAYPSLALLRVICLGELSLACSAVLGRLLVKGPCFTLPVESNPSQCGPLPELEVSGPDCSLQKAGAALPKSRGSTRLLGHLLLWSGSAWRLPSQRLQLCIVPPTMTFPSSPKG